MAEAENDSLPKPDVLWTQRKDMIMLTIKYNPTEKPDFKIFETHLTFKGHGIGASGKQLFGFNLVFCNPISTEKARIKFRETEVELKLLKKESGQWPRLQSKHQKPHWIKTDFDHLHISDTEEEEDDEDEAKRVVEEQIAAYRKKMEEKAEFYNQLKDVGHRVKICYLVLYNLAQFMGFLFIVLKLLYLLKDGWDGISRAYESTGPVIRGCQMAAALEIVNALFGFVKGGVKATLMQVIGRAFVLFVTLGPLEILHNHPIVYALFMSWSLVELFRYPYYALSLIDKNIPIVTWLRYSVWMPLYPLGFTCETVVLYLAIREGPPGGVWSYGMPNVLNFPLNLSTLQTIVLITMPYFAYTLILHMAVQRKKKLSTSKTVTKSKKKKRN